MEKQVTEYAGGNEIAAIAIKQIGYDLMGYYPITPSTQIAENLDDMRAKGETDLIMIAAEGEHSAAASAMARRSAAAGSSMPPAPTACCMP